jgi:hypothetical protein
MDKNNISPQSFQMPQPWAHKSSEGRCHLDYKLVMIFAINTLSSG